MRAQGWSAADIYDEAMYTMAQGRSSIRFSYAGRVAQVMVMGMNDLGRLGHKDITSWVSGIMHGA